MDWLLLLCLKDKKQEYVKLDIHNIKSKIEDVEEEKIIEKEHKVDEKTLQEIKEKLSWEYKYLSSSKVPTKTSVTKLKEEKQKELGLIEILNKEKQYVFSIPKFYIQKEEKVTSARKGSLIHLCFEKIDICKECSKEDIEKLINDLAEKEIILKEEAEAINVNILLKYTQSDLFKELKLAKEVHKEKPFYIEVSADRLDKEFSAEDKILVQGIIDLYYIDKNDKLILVDYKTDYVEKDEEKKLIERYTEQLNIYKEAMEKSLNRKVDKVLIYSTYLGEIELK